MAETRRITAELSELAQLAGNPAEVDELLRRALDALQVSIAYDLAAVLELEEGALKVRCARGPLVNDQVLALKRPVPPSSVIAEALNKQEALVVQAHDHEAGEDPFQEVVPLPDGHACMVVPLVAGGSNLGVMTFDRTECTIYPQETVEIATIYGQLIALALVAARHAEALSSKNKKLAEQNRLLQAESQNYDSAARQISSSEVPSMQALATMAQKVADSSAPVLITGETGTGKEILARAIHEWSPRKERSFVKINCASLPEQLLESELFGHIKGAFSGATQDRPGRFVVADGGTLLLDEIGDMPLSAQAKLLRVLQEGTLEPVGSDRTVTVDVRILAATHVNLEKAIEQGRFREDLYYRLSLFPLNLPPLRARKEDLPGLCTQILRSLSARSGRGPWAPTAATLQLFAQHDWPGNVRELVNCLERATILAPGGELGPELFALARSLKSPSQAPAVPVSSEAATCFSTLAQHEAQYISQVLQHTEGKIYGDGGAAQLLGLKPSTLQSRMNKLGIARKPRA